MIILSDTIPVRQIENYTNTDHLILILSSGLKNCLISFKKSCLNKDFVKQMHIFLQTIFKVCSEFT